MSGKADCPIISLDRYWNWVGIPMFLIIFLFGIYVLFQLSSIQMIRGTTAYAQVMDRITRLDIRGRLGTRAGNAATA